MAWQKLKRNVRRVDELKKKCIAALQELSSKFIELEGIEAEIRRLEGDDTEIDELDEGEYLQRYTGHAIRCDVSRIWPKSYHLESE